MLKTVKYWLSNPLAVIGWFPFWVKLTPRGIVRPACRKSMSELGISNEFWSERCRATVWLRNWRTENGHKATWNIPCKIMFRYLLLLRCTNDRSCRKENGKTIKWPGCRCCVHPTEHEAKSKTPSVESLITANSHNSSWTTEHSWSQTFNCKHFLFFYFFFFFTISQTPVSCGL